MFVVGVCGAQLEKFGGGTSDEKNTGRDFTSSCQRANAAAADAAFWDQACSSSEARSVTAVEIPQPGTAQNS